MNNTQRKTDNITGTETTGHEWDGIEELDTPMPRWWLIVFYITIIWAVGYWFYYPAWPTLSGEGERGGTVGSADWTQYNQLADQQAEINAVRAQYQKQFENADFADVQADDTLYAYAIAGGKSAFGDNCATCHGTGGAGAPGYPNLNDDDWLWGGGVEDIYQTLKFGIRSNHPDTRFSEMPAFGEILSADEVSSLAAYLLDENPVSGSTGATLYEENCAVCHGDQGRGLQDFGAPNLRDSIWFYGDDKAEIEQQIKNPKHGVMPAWEDRLSDSTLRQLSVYVHSLGGGQ